MSPQFFNRRFLLLLAGGLLLLIALPFLSGGLLLASGVGGLQPNSRAPDFQLHTRDQQLVTLNEQLSRPLFLSFGYQHCNQSCPVQISLLKQIAAEVGAQAGFVWISLDPETDIHLPPLNQQYLFPQLQELFTETTAEAEALARGYNGSSRKVSSTESDYLQHTSFVYLIDQHQTLRLIYQGTATSADTILADLKALDIIKDGV